MRKKISPPVIVLLLTAMFAMVQTTSGQTTFPLDVTVKKDSITLSLPSAKNLRLLSDKPLLVKLANNRVSEPHRNAIHLTVADANLSLVNMEVNMSVFQSPGNYEVTCKYITGVTDTQSLVIILSRAPAALDTPPTIHISMEGGNIRSDALPLHEKGGSPIPELTYSPAIIKGADTAQLLNFTPDARSIRAGGFMNATYIPNYDLLSDLPLGLTTAQIWISAPQLPVPVPVNIEIRHTRAKWLIILFVLLGLALGFFVRYFLKDGREWEEARLKGIAIAQEIQTGSVGIEDLAYRKSIDILLTGLMASLQARAGFFSIGPSAADLTATVNAALTDYRTKRDQFNISMEQQQQVFLEYQPVYGDGNLNKELLLQLTEVSSIFAKAKGSLDQFNLTSAREQIALGVRETGQVLEKLVGYYGKYEMLQTAVIPSEFTPGMRITIQEYFDNIKSQITKMTAPGATIAVRMTSIDSIFEIKDYLWNYMLKQLDFVYRTDDPNIDQENLADLKKILEEYRQSIEDIRSNPQELQGPGGYWNNGLLERLTEAWDEIHPRAKGVIPEELPDNGNGTPVPGDLMEAGTPDKLRKFAAVLFQSAPDIDIPALARESMKNYMLYTILRTTLLALLMSLGAYKFYAANFVGDFDELIGILLFAFSLDVTADGVATLRDKKS